MTSYYRFPIFQRPDDKHWIICAEPGTDIPLPNTEVWSERDGTRPVMVDRLLDAGRVSYKSALRIRDAMHHLYMRGYVAGRDEKKGA